MDLQAREPRPGGWADTPADQQARMYERSTQLLGGRKLIKRTVLSPLDAHTASVDGVPYQALLHLIVTSSALGEGEVAAMLCISTRTLQRQKETPDKPMPPDLASKTWLLAEMLSRATDVFGTRAEAEAWLTRPAMGLDGQRPIELLQTVQGAEIVGDFLTRLEHGVYS